MSLRKWIYILLFAGILLIGIPTSADAEEEIKPSSVKECRVHIEKAIEEYFDKNEPNERTNVKQNTNHLSIKDSDERYVSSSENPIEETNEEDELAEEANQIPDENQEDDEDETDEDDDDDDDEENDDDVDNENVDLKPEKNDLQSEKCETDEDDEDENEVDDDDEENGDEDDQENDDDESDEPDSSEDKDASVKAESIEDKEEKDKPTDVEEEDDDEDEDDENEESRKAETDDDEEEEDDEEDDKDGEEEDDDDESNKAKTEADDDDDDDDDDDEEEADDDEDLSVELKTSKEPTSKLSESETVDSNKAGTSESKVNEIKKENEQVFTADKIEKKVIPESIQVKDDASDSESDQKLDGVEPGTEEPDEIDEKDDDTIENIYEEDDDEESAVKLRSREHVDAILDLDSEGEEYKKEEAKLARSIYNEIKKVQTTNIRPMELLYKYADSTTRALGDAELFNKPMLLFLGPWNSGKTSVINYILGIENTPMALKTGTGITDTDFTIINSGDRHRMITGTELAADWRYAGTQKFGQGFLDHFRSIQIPHPLLEKVILIDTPGILENRKNTERGYPLNDVFQWFVDRADAIYVVLDPMKVDIGAELGSVVEQLKGRDTRFILNKADTIRRSDLMRVVGQLFWNLSPLMSSTEAPLIYAVSLSSRPFHPSAPAKFLTDQEKNFFYDMKSTLEKHVESKILYARRHAVRVRNHAKMVDCFLATYYRHKSIFSNKRNVAKLITDNPKDYNIFDGFGSVSNVSRYDLPNPQNYKEFFKLHPLYDFKPLASTCSYFRGCPMDKLDLAITKDIPELLAKYKKSKRELPGEPMEKR